MAVFRVERTRDYTVMCNHHLKDSNLSLKAKGLLSMMLSLPDEWNYTTRQGRQAIAQHGAEGGVDLVGGEEGVEEVSLGLGFSAVPAPAADLRTKQAVFQGLRIAVQKLQALAHRLTDQILLVAGNDLRPISDHDDTVHLEVVTGKE